MEVVCKFCGKPFNTWESKLKNNRGKFCSRECMGKYYSETRKNETSTNWKGGLSKNRSAYMYLYQREHPEYAEKARERSRKQRQNPEYQEWEKEYRAKKYIERKAFILSHFGNKCKYCGIEYNGNNASIFDFHHLDPNEKEISISGTKDINKIICELKKGILVCSNCHRLLHHEGIK